MILDINLYIYGKGLDFITFRWEKTGFYSLLYIIYEKICMSLLKHILNIVNGDPLDGSMINLLVAIRC